MQIKTIPIYQIDAFTDECFSGNPAAVCILEEWLPKKAMQYIAAENNLSETAFVLYSKGVYNIRYFSPSIEIELCGHATLASAYVVFRAADDDVKEVIFRTQKRGDLRVSKEGDQLLMLLPKDECHPVEANDVLEHGLGAKPKELFMGKTDYLALFETQEEIELLQPDFISLRKLNVRGIIVTAPGKDVDFVSRFFAPPSGIDEDPVTGSAHTTLTPFWAERLNKKQMIAKQVSQRGGTLLVEELENHVKITGNAVLFMRGEIFLQCKKEMDFGH